MEQRKCPACQKLINSGAKFCNFCGQKQTAITARAAELAAKKFLSVRELAVLQNELSEQSIGELVKLFRHANKYLARLALRLFWDKASPAEKKQTLPVYLASPDFVVSLLDAQPDAAELFTELWPQAAESPWLVHKYLRWAQSKHYALQPETRKYLEAAADAYLQRAYQTTLGQK